MPWRTIRVAFLVTRRPDPESPGRRSQVAHNVSRMMVIATEGPRRGTDDGDSITGSGPAWVADDAGP